MQQKSIRYHNLLPTIDVQNVVKMLRKETKNVTGTTHKTHMNISGGIQVPGQI